MPNTLAHFGIQGVATRALIQEADAKWIFLGCIVGDIPWILRRLSSVLWPSIDPYYLRFYTIVQASLLACFVLSAGLALLSKKPVKVFAVLAVNSVLGLLLDGFQIKWGNGVHLFAPFSWEMLNWGFFWPESLLNYSLTLFGLALFFCFAVRSPGVPVGFSFPRPGWLVLALGLLALWALGPLMLVSGPERADNQSLNTLRSADSRAGRDVEFDRQTLVVEDGRQSILTFAGEYLVVGESLGLPGTVSIRATFIDDQTIRVNDLHRHRGSWRDWASILGLSLLLGLWILPIWQTYAGQQGTEPEGSQSDESLSSSD